MFRRRSRARPTTAAVTVIVCAAAAAAVAHADEATNVERAWLSYYAMQQAYYLAPQHLYRRTTGPVSDPYSYFFPFTQTLAAVTALAEIPSIGPQNRAGVGEHVLGLRSYWNPRSTPPGYDTYAVSLGGAEKYYDDNEWAGLQLVRSYRVLGELALLAQAEATFRMISYGWDSDRSHPCPGGVWWAQSPESFTRNVVSNAPGAELALELYALTRRRSYLEWAKRMYHWVRVCLREQVGLYADSIALSGYVDPTYWIYNQGTMIGAEVMLYEASGQRRYLEGAVESASSTLAYFTPSRLEQQPPDFVAIFAENLLHLDELAPNPLYRAYLESYANSAWANLRNATSGLFEFHEEHPDPLLNQAGMAQLYAYLAWPASSFAAPPPAPAPAKHSSHKHARKRSHRHARKHRRALPTGGARAR
jgi:Glycosyl hydrolase family 76